MWTTYDGDEESGVGCAEFQRLWVGRDEDDRHKVAELNENTRRTDDEERTAAEQRDIQHLQQRRETIDASRLPGSGRRRLHSSRKRMKHVAKIRKTSRFLHFKKRKNVEVIAGP